MIDYPLIGWGIFAAGGEDGLIGICFRLKVLWSSCILLYDWVETEQYRPVGEQGLRSFSIICMRPYQRYGLIQVTTP